MKKYLAIAAVIGLIAVPSLVVANRRNDVANNTEDSTQQELVATQDDSKREADSLDQVDNDEDKVNAQGVKIEGEHKVAAGSISTDEAISIAQGVYPSAKVEKVEIETEDGVTVYSVRFSNSARVDVRATDGRVVRTEPGDQEDKSDDGEDSDSEDESNDD